MSRVRYQLPRRREVSLGAVRTELAPSFWIPAAATFLDMAGYGHGDSPIKMG